MEAIRPKLKSQSSQKSILSNTSTLVPETERLGPAPSLSGLRQFAARLGITKSKAQVKPVDDIERKSTCVEPSIQILKAAPVTGLVKPFANVEKENVKVASSTLTRTQENRFIAAATTLSATVGGSVSAGGMYAVLVNAAGPEALLPVGSALVGLAGAAISANFGIIGSFLYLKRLNQRRSPAIGEV